MKIQRIDSEGSIFFNDKNVKTGDLFRFRDDEKDRIYMKTDFRPATVDGVRNIASINCVCLEDGKFSCADPCSEIFLVNGCFVEEK